MICSRAVRKQAAWRVLAVATLVAATACSSGKQKATPSATVPTAPAQTTTAQQPTTAQTTTQASTTTTGKPAATKVPVSESEFKITLASTKFKAGEIIFEAKNDGKIQHDLAIKGGPKTKLISPGGSAQLTVTLKPGTYHLYCSVPGHEQAGMKLDVTVS